MHYGTLLDRARAATVRAVIIGVGDYGRSLAFQAQRTPGLVISAVCDRDEATAMAALTRAGVARSDIAVCTDAASAEAALARGQAIVTTDPALVIGLGIDVVVESTGNPEAAARHASHAIAAGKHVVMVSKEADSVIGPLLAARAHKAGVVYTPVDGDQPSLLIQLVLWARLIGLEVLCAAKASEYDFVYDDKAGTVTCLTETRSVPAFAELWDLGDRDAREVAGARARALSSFSQHTVADQTEMGIVANALGLGVDAPTLHAPLARIAEIPDMLAPASEGGLLSKGGVVDVVNLLRRPDEFSLAGGVFITARCEDEASWSMLRDKGHVVSRNGKAAMIALPCHLLGVQSATTILLAALEKRSSGTGEVRADLDVVGRATTDLAAGTRLTPRGRHHTIAGVEGLLQKAGPVRPGRPIPFHMMADQVLARDVAAGEIMTTDMIEEPEGSVLWELRREMDRTFFDS